MRLKLLFLIFTLASLMISCADILLEGTSDDVSTSEIVGFWFACEFGSADIDCRFFDDDGLEFTNDGSVYEIEAYIYPPDPDVVPALVLILIDPQYPFSENMWVDMSTQIHH